MNRYETSILRAAFGIAAVAMTAITIGLLVVLSAKMESASHEVRTLAASKSVATEPTEVVIGQPRATGKPVPQMITQDSSARSSTRIQ